MQSVFDPISNTMNTYLTSRPLALAHNNFRIVRVGRIRLRRGDGRADRVGAERPYPILRNDATRTASRVGPLDGK